MASDVDSFVYGTQKSDRSFHRAEEQKQKAGEAAFKGQIEEASIEHELD